VLAVVSEVAGPEVVRPFGLSTSDNRKKKNSSRQYMYGCIVETICTHEIICIILLRGHDRERDVEREAEREREPFTEKLGAIRFRRMPRGEERVPHGAIRFKHMLVRYER